MLWFFVRHAWSNIILECRAEVRQSNTRSSIIIISIFVWVSIISNSRHLLGCWRDQAEGLRNFPNIWEPCLLESISDPSVKSTAFFTVWIACVISKVKFVHLYSKRWRRTADRFVFQSSITYVMKDCPIVSQNPSKLRVELQTVYICATERPSGWVVNHKIERSRFKRLNFLAGITLHGWSH